MNECLHLYVEAVPNGGKGTYPYICLTCKEQTHWGGVGYHRDNSMGYTTGEFFRINHLEIFGERLIYNYTRKEEQAMRNVQNNTYL